MSLNLGLFLFSHPKTCINTSNKLLSLLEEPPQKTIFLLVSENTNLILKTIISRVQIIKIPNYNSIEIEGFLKEKFSSRNGEEIKKIISLLEEVYLHQFRCYITITLKIKTSKNIKTG